MPEDTLSHGVTKVDFLIVKKISISGRGIPRTNENKVVWILKSIAITAKV